MVRPRSRNETVQLDLGTQTSRGTETCAQPEPIEVISGGMLCRLKIWNEQQWAALSESQRPPDYVHVPGLGWVGAVPVTSLN